MGVSSVEVDSVSELHSHCLLELGLGWGAASLNLCALLGTDTRDTWEAVLSPHVGVSHLLSPCFDTQGAVCGSGSLTAGLTNRSGFKPVADCCHHKQICLRNFQNLPG